MEKQAEHISLSELLQKFNKIIIPDVQRDYVMGSGEEKLTKLLNAMAEKREEIKKNEKEKEFNFSCLVGYKDDDNNLYIYDGQQRLATLICLCSYLNDDINIAILLEKFTFKKRDVANEWIRNPQNIKKEGVVDFTTYSLAQLIDKFNSNTYDYNKKIDFNFLFNNVIFDMILVNEVSDAEQFFLDINDGLDLKSYEIYKAELYHHIKGFPDKSYLKHFALKMENKWLKFFLPYRHTKKERVNGENITVCEEEILILFLQYCFRMMWIEEHGNDREFKAQDVRWLTKEHLEFVEQIIDAVISEMEDDSISKVSCVNYSNNNIISNYCNKIKKGQHWNIIDINYDAMLKVFFENIHNVEEANKDIIVWCYISKLPLVNKENLYKYLRFVKKLLNNNRTLCDNAEIYYLSQGIDYKKIVYTGYYVQGIPKYYINYPMEPSNKNEIFDILNTIIILNKNITFNSNEDFVYIYFSLCKDSKLKKVLDKERKKYNSKQRESIEKYENLPFINGLVDNFIFYTDETCELKEWARKINVELFGKVLTIQTEYKDILKFIYNNKINVNNLIFHNIRIRWKNYGGKKIHNKIGSLIPHTWCDLFTNENGIDFCENTTNNSILDYLPALPDGWIDGNKIIQPKDTEVEGKKGFASRGKTHEVFDMSNFLENYSWICKSKQLDKYIINGDEEYLPQILKNPNSKKWIETILSNTEKVYYSDQKYLNDILMYKFKAINKNNESDCLIKENKISRMCFVKINNTKFFIKKLIDI